MVKSNGKHKKTALVLAGGGLTGAVYEIGALRAIDDLLVDRTVNDFDIFVGTSAGALVSAFLANGMSPEDMFQVIAGASAEKSLKREHIFRLNYSQFLEWGLRLPLRLAGLGRQYFRKGRDSTLFDLLWAVTGTLPGGLYDSLALDEFIREMMEALGYNNRFEDLQKELHIIATDLRNGERVVFDQESELQIPVSMAVAASSALPLVYKPVTVAGREYVDGGLRGTASLDLAIERGATLVVCINPLVPLTDEADETNPQTRLSKPIRNVNAGGFAGQESSIQTIANQTLRIFSHAGLHYHIKQLRRSHPEVDIILIEPRQGSSIFTYNIMRYSARMEVAQQGFESVTLDLAVEYPMYKQVLARHGIPLSRRLVISEMAEIIQSNYDPDVIARILEARSNGCGQRHRDTPICQLNRTLAELELALEDL